MVGTYYTTKHVFDIKENDVLLVHGRPRLDHRPLVRGLRTADAGDHRARDPRATPDYPDPGSWWSIMEEYGVNILYTAPTAIRMFMKMGEQWPDRYRLSALRVARSVG